MSAPRRPGPTTPSHTDPTWYQQAVFYEVLPRSFYDHGGAGCGTLAGITEKLDYIAWLGVDCIWIPPFFTSPLKDGGYDVADYYNVLPAFGTLEDARTLVEQAHARGLKVIADLVVNHTSDQHPWFQASRSDPEGEYGDFYVWSDTDAPYSDARIIFIDTETSNWTFDPVRGQYFWHRFFSHQPDLNYDNPRVIDAIEDVVRFWFDIGFDGLRLDAIPYLVERDGTNCENLPDTHRIIARLRALIDAEYPGRILLAEANQWPEDVVEYFGTDSAPECHMCFHFPLMPRLFLAAATSDTTNIRQILAATPPIPSSAAWGTFLRNHDELTLEMVNDAERAALYEAYAPLPRMRANVGIRRRLKPLLGGDDDKVMLLNQALLGLPGAPCLYYGDEIGMGDVIDLPDRDAVRTPMQWDNTPNGGFSTTTGPIYPPVNTDPAYGPAATNVAAQQGDPSSLLERTRRLLAARAMHPIFATGGCDFLDTATTPTPPTTTSGNRTEPLLVWVRHQPGHWPIVCVANFSNTTYSFTATIGGHLLSTATPATAGEGNSEQGNIGQGSSEQASPAQANSNHVLSAIGDTRTTASTHTIPSPWQATNITTLLATSPQADTLVFDDTTTPATLEVYGTPTSTGDVQVCGTMGPWECHWFQLSRQAADTSTSDTVGSGTAANPAGVEGDTNHAQP